MSKVAEFLSSQGGRFVGRGFRYGGCVILLLLFFWLLVSVLSLRGQVATLNGFDVAKIESIQSDLILQQERLQTIETNYNDFKTRMTGLDGRIETVETALTKVQTALLTLGDELQAAKTQVESYRADVGKVSDEEMVALQERVRAMEQKVEQAARQINSARPAAATPVRRQVARPASPKPVAQPFVVIGVENRGSEQFLAVAPNGSQSLADVRLLRQNDSYGQSWRLKSVAKGQAVFDVGGQEKIVRVP